MTVLSDFGPGVTLHTDSAKRMDLASMGAQENMTYLGSHSADGSILLTLIPEDERPLWEDPEIHADLTRGLLEAAHGEVGPLGWDLHDDE